MNNQESNTIRMTCQECGGTMDIDKDKTILYCPYCGSKKLIMESDTVRIERIKAEHELEMEKETNEYNLKMEKHHIRSWIYYFIGILVFFGSLLFLSNLMGVQ